MTNTEQRIRTRNRKKKFEQQLKCKLKDIKGYI